MRQWRVGTFSMGLLLVGSGLGLLVAQFNAEVVNSVMRWWPLLLIVLGIEVLVYTYFKKSDDGRVRYDVFSIIIILFLVFSGVGLKTAQDVGVIRLIQEQLQLSNYTMNLPESQVQFPPQIQKVVLYVERSSKLEIRSTSIDVFQAGGDVQIRARSKEEARQMADQALQINTREAGSILFINLTGGQNIRDLKLQVPARLELEVSAPGQKLALVADQVIGNFLIRGVDSDVLLPAGADLSVTAINDAPGRVKGNLSWTTSTNAAGPTPGGSAAVNGNNIHQEIKSPENNGEGDASQNQRKDYVSKAQLGNGTYKMTIICEGDCTIRQLP